LRIRFDNSGRAAAVFQVRPDKGAAGPWTYTVGAGKRLDDAFTFPGENDFDVAVHGPNGFLRAFKGRLQGRHSANLTVNATYHDDPGITLEIENHGAATARVRISDRYSHQTTTQVLEPGQRFNKRAQLSGSHGWYDFTVEVDGDGGF